MNKHAVLCIIDGMTDEGFSFSKLPYASAMARCGASGYFDTVPLGFEVESYPCIASLLGIPAEDLPTYARGYLEAVGAGLAIERDDLILRASWLTLADDGLLHGPAPPPLTAPPLPPGCEYHSLGGYKAILILRGSAHMLPSIKTFAPHACVGQYLADVLPTGEPRLRSLIRLSQQGEKRVLIPWGQSVACQLPVARYRAAALGAALIFAGLTQAMGFDFYTKPGFNGEISTDLVGKTQLALKLAQQYPLVVLHINGADEAAHRRNAVQKQMFLNMVGELVLKPLLKARLPLLVCADHGASPASGLHIGGPQPFALVNTAYRGDMGNLPASAALKLLLEEE